MTVSRRSSSARLRGWFSSQLPSPCTRRPRTPPRLEVLEDRTVPAGFVVTNNLDAGAGSLRAAILQANAQAGADTITFNLPAGQETIGVTSNDANFAFGPTGFVITDDLTIQGTTSGTGVTIDGMGQRRLFGVMAGAGLRLEYLTLTGGNATGGNGGAGGELSGGGGGGAGLGGAIFNNGSVVITNSLLHNNTARGGDGGGLIRLLPAEGGGGGGSSAFAGGRDIGVGAGGGGGGVRGPGGDSTGSGGLGGANAANQQAADQTDGSDGGGGGGGNFDKPGGKGTASTTAGFGGGGGGGGGGKIGGTGGDGGFAAGGGGAGGIGSAAGGSGGFGGGGGGGAAINGRGGKGMAGGEGASGTASSGGAGGGGLGAGGAVFNNQGATLTILNSTLTANSATGGSGGDARTTRVAGSGPGAGGAVFNRNGTVTVVNSTLAGNAVIAGSGGGDTIAVGGALFNLSEFLQTATVHLFNSILADSNNGIDLGTFQDKNSTAVINAATNIIESSIINFDNSATINQTGTIAADPNLGPLANNGGPTRTMLPGAGPAIDAGNNQRLAQFGYSLDQRGRARLVNGKVDLGAVETGADAARAGRIHLVAFEAATGVLTFDVIFRHPVKGVGLSDFRLSRRGNVRARIVSVTGSGAVYQVQVQVLGGSGFLRLRLRDDNSIHDRAGAPLGGPRKRDGNFSSRWVRVRSATRLFDVAFLVSGGR